MIPDYRRTGNRDWGPGIRKAANLGGDALNLNWTKEEIGLAGFFMAAQLPRFPQFPKER
jgi:hypothetical protein